MPSPLSQINSLTLPTFFLLFSSTYLMSLSCPPLFSFILQIFHFLQIPSPTLLFSPSVQLLLSTYLLCPSFSKPSYFFNFSVQTTYSLLPLPPSIILSSTFPFFSLYLPLLLSTYLLPVLYPTLSFLFLFNNSLSFPFLLLSPLFLPFTTYSLGYLSPPRALSPYLS